MAKITHMKLSELPKWRSLKKGEKERLKKVYGVETGNTKETISKKELEKTNHV